jgi:ABC-type multidrug transport system ATPase subunit
MSLRIKSLKKSFDNTIIFKCLTASFETGCFLLHGKNGIGKSSFFNILAGSDSEFAGDITLNKTDIRQNHDQYLEKVSFTPDRLNFFSHIELKHAFQFIRKNRLHIDQAKLDHFIEAFNLRAYFETPLGKLSLGNQKKFMLSIGLSVQADLYLFDEPLNGLDHHGKQVFIDSLPLLGTISIIASHRSHDYDHIAHDAIAFESLLTSDAEYKEQRH